MHLYMKRDLQEETAINRVNILMKLKLETCCSSEDCWIRASTFQMAEGFMMILWLDMDCERLSWLGFAKRTERFSEGKIGSSLKDEKKE